MVLDGMVYPELRLNTNSVIRYRSCISFDETDFDETDFEKNIG